MDNAMIENLPLTFIELFFQGLYERLQQLIDNFQITHLY